MKKIYFLILNFVFSIAFAQSGANVTMVMSDPTAMCNSGDCVSTVVNYSIVKETTSYQVQTIPFNLEYSTTGGTMLNNSADDVWSPIVDLPFNFCFYGQTYNKILVGSNGLVTFDIAGQVTGGTQTASGSCNWSFSTSIPSVTFPIKNAIYGVYQDTNISAPPVINPVVQNVNYYVSGVYPNRAFIVNFNELPLYQCNSSAGLQTSQIVFHETTNIIDIKIKNRTACSTWNGGRGVVGIQNQAGTIANVPPGRNTGTWNATNEAWRFMPDGNSMTNLIWSVNGVEVASNVSPFIICPNNGDVLQAKVIYTNCSNGQVVLQDEKTILLDQAILQVSNPNNLTVCAQNGDLGSFDLTQNNSIVLNGLDPQLFWVTYHVNQADANNSINPIANPQAFNSAGQTIYVYIENLNTGCFKIKQFELFVNTAPPAPTGNAIQTFNQGQTLADLVVSGSNIKWYGSATGNDLLSSNTALVHGVTYYASQTSITTNCESKMSTPQRLAVTVQDALEVNDFDFNSFKAYPNPAKDVLNLSYPKEISKVSVHNLLGQEVLSKSVNAMQSQIDLSRLAVGTYLVRVTVDGLENTIKIVKE